MARAAQVVPRLGADVGNMREVEGCVGEGSALDGLRSLCECGQRERLDTSAVKIDLSL